MFIQQIAMAAPSAGGGEQAPGSSVQMFVPMAIMVAIFYFVLIRPQRRREKERKAMVDAVTKGERVLLSSGIIGEVSTVKDRALQRHYRRGQHGQRPDVAGLYCG